MCEAPRRGNERGSRSDDLGDHGATVRAGEPPAVGGPATAAETVLGEPATILESTGVGDLEHSAPLYEAEAMSASKEYRLLSYSSTCV